jgi:hypothetical protein
MIVRRLSKKLHFLVIGNTKRSGYFIPKRVLSSAEQLTELRRLIYFRKSPENKQSSTGGLD